MATMKHHVTANIEGILRNNTDKMLGIIFDGYGPSIRIELEQRMAAGEVLLGSEGCIGFDPITGCPGHHLAPDDGLALSVKNPWAHLIVSGIKDIENRTWSTQFRGTVLIHVSGKIDDFFKGNSLAFTVDQWKTVNEKVSVDDVESRKLFFATSAIIGQVDIVNCVLNHPSVWAEKTVERDQPIYNWILENPIMYEEPITNVKGALKFWKYVNCKDDKK